MMPRDRFTFREALNFNIAETVDSSDNVAPVVWTDMPTLYKAAGEVLQFFFKAYVYNADVFYISVTGSEGHTQNTTGLLVYNIPVNAESGSEIVFTIVGENAKTKTASQETLTVSII